MASKEQMLHARKQFEALSSTRKAVTQDPDLTSRLLSFFSEADGATIAALLVAGVAVVCVVLGRFGFLLVGILAGVGLHAIWERQSFSGGDSASQTRKKGETNLEIVERLLGPQTIPSAKEFLAEDIKAEIAVKITTGEAIQLQGFPHEISSALSDLADGVIESYVRYWYSPILPSDDQFPQASRQILTGFLLALGTHQQRRRPADAFLHFVTNVVSVFIVFLNELRLALMSEDMLDLEIPEALALYLERHPDSNLASIVDSNEQEKRFLATSDDILQAFLDHKTYNCRPVQVFLQKILGGVAFESVAKTIADPHWINSWIVHVLESGEPELLNVIDAGVEDATSGTTPITSNSSSKSMVDKFDHNPSNPGDSGIIPSPNWQKHRSSSVGGNDAMQAAIEEAERLTQMIKDHEASVLDENASTRGTVATDGEDHDLLKNDAQLLKAQVAGDSKSSDPEASAGGPRLDTTPDKSFTSFDQIVPVYRPVAESTRVSPPLTLHNAKITLLDDAQPGEKSTIKNKPVFEYLIQVEPFSAAHSGWMVVRPFPEFEPLHEYLYKIANLSGAPAFARQYQYLPHFKGKTRDKLRLDIEKYLMDALSYETLAESEGMKRFLDKDQGFKKSSAGKGTLKFATPVGDAFHSVGKGVLGGFNSATKGVAAGGQAMFEGVGGLFAGPKKSSIQGRNTRSPTATQARSDATQSWAKGEPIPNTGLKIGPEDGSSSQPDVLEATRRTHSTNSSYFPRRSEDVTVLGANHEISSPTDASSSAIDETNSSEIFQDPEVDDTMSHDTNRHSNDLATSKPTGAFEYRETPRPALTQTISSHIGSDSVQSELSEHQEETMRAIGSEAHTFGITPLDEHETRVAVELMFAAISELFTLSSAWNIRRTLLNAAKNYLLRPGNPTLLSIRDLLQSAMEENLAAANVALRIRQLRENSCPTNEELAGWPAPPSLEQREALRRKARELLLYHGMPQALASVMGATASREALARVFDALQVEQIARGLMSAILLQALKTTIN